MAQVSLKYCEICDESVGRHYCIDCEQLFCERCKMSHLKAKSCKDHIFEEHDKVNSDVKKVRCQDHEQVVVYHCDTCSLLLCNICLPNSHKKQEFSIIKDAAAREKDVLQKYIQLTGSQISTFKDKVATIFKLIDEFKAANAKTVQEITKKGQNIKDLVDKITSSNIDEVKREETKQLAQTSEEQRRIKEAIMQGQSVIRAVSSALKDKSDTAFLAAVPEFKRSFEAMQAPEIQCLKQETEEFATKRFRQNSTEEENETSLQSILGHLEDNRFGRPHAGYPGGFGEQYAGNLGGFGGQQASYLGGPHAGNSGGFGITHAGNTGRFGGQPASNFGGRGGIGRSRRNLRT